MTFPSDVDIPPVPAAASPTSSGSELEANKSGDADDKEDVEGVIDGHASAQDVPSHDIKVLKDLLACLYPGLKDKKAIEEFKGSQRKTEKEVEHKQ